jgi:DNA-directed RNA polymerase specialized sigma24 family protein
VQPPDPDTRLGDIDTRWTLVRQAHGDGPAAGDARGGLLARYGGAVRRYLLGAARDADAAEDLFQEFAVVFLTGGLRAADPARGRFRDYVKGVLFRLAADYHKKAKRRSGPLPADEAAAEPEWVAPSDEAFVAAWRDELLARAWAALQGAEATGGSPWYTMLRLRTEHPDASSPELADRLGRQLNKSLTAAAARQLLHRARERFADLLLDEVAGGLADPTPDAVAEELTELGLLEYCRPALDRRGGQSPVPGHPAP